MKKKIIAFLLLIVFTGVVFFKLLLVKSNGRRLFLKTDGLAQAGARSDTGR